MNRSMRLLTVSISLFVLYTGAVSPLDAKGKNVTIDKGGQKTTIAFTGNAVTVTSGDNNITPTGECSCKLTVKGKDNNVAAATIREVVVSGTDVNVIEQPKISQKKGNDINIAHNGP